MQHLPLPALPPLSQPSAVMQRPTCTGLRVRSPADAHAIFHAVSLNMLPMVSRRLDTEERRTITSGCVFVWEERGSNAEATGLGIERWTDSIRWGPSRVKDEFLFYHEKEPEQTDLEMTSDSDTTLPSTQSGRGFLRDNLVKQTYSVFVETPRGRRKWHLIAYFNQESMEYLRSIDDIPELRNIRVPPGKYKSARSAKGRPRDPHTLIYDRHVVPVGHPRPNAHPQYAAFSPGAHLSSASHTHPLNRISADAALRGAQGVLPGTRPSQDRRLLADGGILAPLVYLQNLSPPRRHPFDEEALMAFQSGRAI